MAIPSPAEQALKMPCDLATSVEDHTSEPQYGIDKRYEVLFGAMETISTGLFGLTMECCRCHNHKYDPLPQRERS